MEVTQHIIRSTQTEDDAILQAIKAPCDLLLVFTSPAFFSSSSLLTDIIASGAPVAGCGTSGEITAGDVREQSAVFTRIDLKGKGFARIAVSQVHENDYFNCGKTLGESLLGDDLKAVIIFTRGIDFVPGEMFDGLHHVLGTDLLICGGMAGDNASYVQTFTLSPQGISDHDVVAAGLYGDNLAVSQAVIGGWQSFGPIRQVTRSENNILYELDGTPALDIYKKYLGRSASRLPISGLLFPLEMMDSYDEPSGLLRALYDVNETDGSLILGGKIEQGAYLRLMHASTNDLISGVEDAAQSFSLSVENQFKPAFALVVSCLARKIVMGDQVEEEVEAITSALGQDLPVCGFYSNGEFGPLTAPGPCKLHNQTMIVTLFGTTD